MASAFPVASLKTEKGLSQLNDILADRSYVAGTLSPTSDDLACLNAIHLQPSKQQFPHLSRWHRHISALRSQHADYYEWPKPGAGGSSDKAKKGRAPGKEKATLVIDCLPTTMGDIRTPSRGPLRETAGSRCLPGSDKSPEGKYYITTAINYANGWPHIGHAYEAMTADVFARYHRMLGQDVHYLTGSDEHGQKIADAAAAENLKPIDICDRYSSGFQALNQRLNVSNDDYIRTTMDKHKEQARAVWKVCKDKGDIYLSKYEGWYLVREERFITDQEAEEWKFLDPGTGKPLTKMSEDSFFFRLSKYQAPVIKYIEDHVEFVQPKQYRTELLERLKNMEMRDLSISRGSFAWGVPCPEDLVDGKSHVMYVWFDALINYYSGVGGLDAKNPLNRFWPADMHVVGKDICWFHAVIWPAMLMSAGIKLPKSIVVHGFISGPDGRKMSKSFGNVVDPHELLDRLPCDTVRWYLCRESAYGDDVKFSGKSMKLMHNADLCDNLGNLVNRAVNLCGGSVPDCNFKLVSLPFDLGELKKVVRKAFDEYRLSEAADLTVKACGATNKWVADLEPWKMKEDRQELKASTLRMLLEAIYVLAHFFAPYIPDAAEAIFKKLGTPPRPIPKLSNEFKNLTTGGKITTGSVLFAVQDTKDDADEGVAPAAAAAAPPAKADAKDAKGKDAATKGKDAAKAKAKAAPAKPVDDPNQPLFSKLEVRVGKVVKAWHHPEADRLFCEEIDVGEPTGPRQIVSGLREHYTLEQFQGRKILVVCNMKPAKLKNVLSSGMVLCAKNPEKGVVELIDVPESANVGDRLLPKGMADTWAPADPSIVKKSAIWEEVAKELRSNTDRVACYAGVPLVTAAQTQFLAPTLPDAGIS